MGSKVQPATKEDIMNAAAQAIIETIVADIGEQDWKMIKEALEDGAALAAFGISDQEAVEEAHEYATSMIGPVN